MELTEQTYETLPQNVKDILDSWDDDKNLYAECDRIGKELKPLGYEIEYGLSGDITDITKVDTVEENNGLIAEFMAGAPVETHHNQYHTNWNELMSVVEHIEATKEAHIHIETNLTKLFCDGQAKSFYSAGSKLLNTYEAVVEFIQWYNKQHDRN